MLNNNRHATCVDCHSAHASNQTMQFSAAPGLRPSQAGTTGVSAVDGITTVTPAVNQYETCLRCHGTSIGKQQLIVYGYSPVRVVSATDPLNLISQFASSATSSHPVTHARSSPLPQPSLLVNMLDREGTCFGANGGNATACALTATTAMTIASSAGLDPTARMVRSIHIFSSAIISSARRQYRAES